MGPLLTTGSRIESPIDVLSASRYDTRPRALAASAASSPAEAAGPWVTRPRDPTQVWPRRDPFGPTRSAKSEADVGMDSAP